MESWSRAWKYARPWFHAPNPDLTLGHGSMEWGAWIHGRACVHGGVYRIMDPPVDLRTPQVPLFRTDIIRIAPPGQQGDEQGPPRRDPPQRPTCRGGKKAAVDTCRPPWELRHRKDLHIDNLKGKVTSGEGSNSHADREGSPSQVSQLICLGQLGLHSSE